MAITSRPRLAPSTRPSARAVRVPEHSTSRAAASGARRRAWRFDLLLIVGSLAFTVALFGVGTLILRVA
jgi:hypothetical protein